MTWRGARASPALLIPGLIGALGCAAPTPQVVASPATVIPPPQAPPGTTVWGGIGAGRDGYRVSLDSNAPWNRRATWHLTHAGAVAGQPVWMLRSTPAALFAGRRVRLDIDVRTQGGPAEYDLRAQTRSQATLGPVVHTRIEPIAGFRHTSLVLDVPVGTESIVFGPGTVSPSELWVADSSITVVDPSVPLTLAPPIEIGSWHVLGTARLLYEATLDPAAKRAESTPLRMHALGERPFPTYAAGAFVMVHAETFQGKRVRATVWIRTAEATDAGCVVRVERAAHWTLGDALGSRVEPLAPTADWHACTQEITVAPDAGWILVGAKLQGIGDVWLDAASVTPVDAQPSAPPP